ncbi:MAG: nucleotidyltransferase domain-containing protein [Synechococcus sp. SupBloom_Metag_053]|jgi:uncharacterized protein|nr:nucleotidyltransferase domain-containing protein [Synechococcus sp. SupBloom_Metag_053]
MNNLPLQPTELEQVCLVLSRHPTVLNATIFGSRAKGTHSNRSDIDLALAGPLDALGAEAIAAELEELPLPYLFDVQALDSITYEPLIKHIERVGIKIYFRKDQIYIKQLIASD